MEILLNPNLEFLVLVFAMVMAVLALLSPGTGLFEIGALAGFIFVGWAVFLEPDQVNFWAFGLLVLGVGLLVIAIRSAGQPVLLALAMASVMAGTVLLFKQPDSWLPSVDPFLALITAAVAGGFLWFVARKVLETTELTPSHDLNRLMGAVGEAKTMVDGEGTVQVLGELWTARSREKIPAGSSVRVVGREGFVLTVERAPGEVPDAPEPV